MDNTAAYNSQIVLKITMLFRTQGNFLYLTIFILLTILSQLPIWIVDYPVLSDYPNHLARMHILMHAKNMGILASFYEIQWSVLPNIAMDMLVPLLGTFLGIELSGKIFIAATLFLISSGTLFLHFALHRRPSIWPFLCFFFLYNNLFLYGVLNFLFALGISLWAIGLWIWTSERPSKSSVFTNVRIVILFFLTSFIFLCHLSAYVFFAFFIIAYELRFSLSNKVFPAQKKILFIIFITILLPLVALISISPTSNISAIEKSDIPFDSYILAMVIRKALSPLGLISNYHNLIDALTFLALGLIVMRSFFSKTLKINRIFVPILTILAIGFVIAPFSIFGSHMADTRILVALSFLLVACTDIEAGRYKMKIFVTLVFLICLFTLRIGIIIDTWRYDSSLAGSIVNTASKLPEGARHFSSFAREKDYGSYSGAFKRQIICLTIISRSAFVPAFYSMHGAQPVLLKSEFNEIKARSPGLLSSPYEKIQWSQILEDFDFLWVGPKEIFNEFPKEHLSLVEKNADFLVYKVLK